MILSSLLVAGVTFRRLISLRNLVLALVGGALAGLLALGVPSPALSLDALEVLVAIVAALVVLPVVAGLPTADRLGGYEQLQGVRPVRSLAFAMGRMQGSFVAGILLLLIVAHVAHVVAGTRTVPRQLSGKSEPTTVDGEAWRFPLPAGAEGPFRLTVATHVAFVGAGQLEVITRRSEGEHRQLVNVLPVRRHDVMVPDLAPYRGDLYVTFIPQRGVVLGAEPPTITVGSQPLGIDRPAMPRSALARLAFALLVVLASAHAFHFETACLAGAFALAVTPPRGPWLWLASLVLLVAFAAVGTALVRRQALP